jgi:hypothetical protein
MTRRSRYCPKTQLLVSAKVGKKDAEPSPSPTGPEKREPKKRKPGAASTDVGAG